MVGDLELLRLADLLRLGANTARQIATLRKVSTDEIFASAECAERIARDLERIVGVPSMEQCSADMGSAKGEL